MTSTGYVAAHPKQEAPYLYFEYYPSTAFGDREPTRELLDTAVSDRPVLCQDFSEHEHWVNREGVDVHIHLVGDRAFRTACDAVAAAKARCTDDNIAWRIQVTFSHCELVDPADMARPAELGIIVNWTPHWSGGYFGEESRNAGRHDPGRP